MSRHLRHICLIVGANVFKVSIENIVLQEDRIITDVTVLNQLQNLRPDPSMIFYVVLSKLRTEPDDLSIALQVGLLLRCLGRTAIDDGIPVITRTGLFRSVNSGDLEDWKFLRHSKSDTRVG